MLQVLAQSMLAGLATVAGALFILIWGRPGRKPTAFLLGLASGVMIIVISLDLLPRAISAGRMVAVAGICLGIFGCKASGLFVTRIIQKMRIYGGRQAFFRMGIIIALSIALHDFPEGLAIGAGFAESGELGTTLAIAIGLHNIPEGIGVAVPLYLAGSSKLNILALCLLISLVTPLGAVIGAFISTVNPFYIGFLLAFAAGAMLFVVVDEIIPASHNLSRGFTLLGLTLGAVMVILWL